MEETTWETTHWREWAPKDAWEYFINRSTVHEHRDESIVALSLELNDVPRDFLIHVLVHALMREADETDGNQLL